MSQEFVAISTIKIVIHRPSYSKVQKPALPTHLKYIDIEPKTQQFNRFHHTRTQTNRVIIYISRLKMGYVSTIDPASLQVLLLETCVMRVTRRT